jgi:hypothetical protein
MNKERKIETEEVTGIAPPPRARVTDTFERKRDYLAGFLAGEKEEEPAAGPGSDIQASVVEVLKSIYDPEIPVDIYELGLIYDVEVSEDGDATITMTLTTPTARSPNRCRTRSSCACCRSPESATRWSTWCGIRRGIRRK